MSVRLGERMARLGGSLAAARRRGPGTGAVRLRMSSVWGVAAMLALTAIVTGCGDTKTVVKTVTAPNSASVPSTTASKPKSKNCDDLGINSQQLNEGVCFTKGRKFKVVNRASTLRLGEINVQLVGSRLVKTLGGEFSSARAMGMFWVATVVVRNTTNAPQDFNGSGDQDGAFLVLGNGKVYTQTFDAANGPDQQSCIWKSTDNGGIQPDGMETCDLIFDLPPSAAAKVERDGDLVVVNPSESASATDGSASLYGEIRVYH